MLQNLIEYLNKNSVLILGLGREGRSSYDIIRRYLPEKELGIADIKDIDLCDPYTKIYSGPDYLNAINDYDVIIKSPGLSLKGTIIPENATITCQTDLFLHFADCMCVGITGTKGKSSTSAVLYDILSLAGKRVCLTGTIGTPVLDTLEEGNCDIAVIEISSHQLEYTTASPHIAAITNIYSEHLSHYNGFEQYANSKMNILRHQTKEDYFICSSALNCDDYYDFSHVLPTILKVSPFGPDFSRIASAAEKNEHLCGNHNKYNLAVAVAIARCLDVSDDVICNAIRNYKGLEHRLEPVGEYRGIKFYNDVLATIPVATQCAINALNNVDTLILGGMDRGIGYDSFEDFLIGSSVRNIIGLPDTGIFICNNIAGKTSAKNIMLAEDLDDAVKKAFACTKKGKSCLLSPAASSYNVYKDFEHKGKHFKELVKSFG